MKSLCLFGGSFDPIHLGHLLVARAALEELEVERVFFVPAAVSPFKTHAAPTPARVRAAMLRTGLVGRSWACVDEQEIERGGISYTVDTLRAYRQRYPGAKIYYLIGEDNATALPQWKEPGELARLADFVVIPRPARAGDSGPNVQPEGFRLRYLKGFPTTISSSVIRERVRVGLPVEDLLPAGVAEILRNNELYL